VADDEEGFSMSLHLDDDGLQAGDHVQVGLASVEGGREGARERGREGGIVSIGRSSCIKWREGGREKGREGG